MPKLILGDAIELLKTIPDNSIDSVVTDPPYGISFMAKGWDTFKGNQEYAKWCKQWARECLRVLKPGGHLLAFSGTRTYHALGWGIESAGFEIRDMIEWLYASGFPKSMDISKQFDKMAGVEREVIGERSDFVARRNKHKFNQFNAINPSSKGINSKEFASKIGIITAPVTPLAKQWDGWGTSLKPAHEPIVMARKPLEGTVCANVEKWGTGAINVDGCRIPMDDKDKEELQTKTSKNPTSNYADKEYRKYGKYARDIATPPHDLGRFPANCITTDNDQWYSKYFNVTPQEISKKASKKDRNGNWRGEQVCNNLHPTVKLIDLMAWLIRLVTPPGGIVLDPFAGSGSTLAAAKREGFDYIGIEIDQEYIKITEARIGESKELVEIS